MPVITAPGCQMVKLGSAGIIGAKRAQFTVFIPKLIISFFTFFFQINRKVMLKKLPNNLKKRKHLNLKKQRHKKMNLLQKNNEISVNKMKCLILCEAFMSWGCFHDKIFLPWPKFIQTLYKQMNLAVFRLDLYSCFYFLRSLNYFIKVHRYACVDFDLNSVETVQATFCSFRGISFKKIVLWLELTVYSFKSAKNLF